MPPYFPPSTLALMIEALIPLGSRPSYFCSLSWEEIQEGGRGLTEVKAGGRGRGIPSSPAVAMHAAGAQGREAGQGGESLSSLQSRKVHRETADEAGISLPLPTVF